MPSWINGNLQGRLSPGQGEPGKSLEYMWRGTELGIRQEGEEEYQFVDLAGGGAASGREIELQVGSGYIQWRYKGEESWNNLIAITELQVQGPQGIPGRDGVNGKDGKNGLDGTNGQDGVDGVTPNITIGTVTTLEAGQQATVTKRGTTENPIFDFGIPKGGNGSNGADGETSIDDTTISTEKTWSSTKIEDFVHTNDDVVWSTVQGENLSVDYTKEGYLREVEVWGNTWQDSDSKNLLDPAIIHPGFINTDGSITAIENNWSTQNWRYSDYIKGLKEGRTYCLSGELVGDLGNHSFVFGFYDSKETLIQRAGRATSHSSGSRRYDTIIVPTGTVYTRISFTVNDADGVRMTKLMLEENSGVTDYVDYYKADLSDIRHLGELYVNDEGQSILDSEGREQYKIEVESCNKNLFCDEIMNGKQIKKIVDGESGYYIDTAIPIASMDSVFVINKGFKEQTRYVFTFTTTSDNWINANILYTDGTVSTAGFIKQTRSIISHDNKTIKFITFTTGGENFIKDIQLEEGIINTNIIPRQSHKTTLLLPCQLMKVGDISDRLYWDSEKKKYVVEKNVDNYIISKYSKIRQWNKTYAIDGTVINSKVDNNALCISDKIKGSTVNLMYGTVSKGIAVSNNIVTISHGVENDLDGATQWVNSLLPINVIYLLDNPQLIETNIIEQILLPCYKDKTHLFVTGGIDGSIKAKVPLDGGQAIQSLSARNVTLNEEVNTLSLENEELKETNDTQDILINTTMLATDEMYMMLEPLLAETLSERSVSKMVDMYVAMVQRGIKTIEQVPIRYREQVKKILDQLEK